MVAGVGGAKSRKTAGDCCARGQGLLWGEERPIHRTGTMSHCRTGCVFNVKLEVDKLHGLVSQRRVCEQNDAWPPGGGGIDDEP